MRRCLGYWAIASAIVIPLLSSTVGSAQTLSSPDSPSTAVPPSANPAVPSVTSSPASEAQAVPAPSPQEMPLTCPANYFASKFSDVTPYDWAYEAVNRIASGEMRCFPLTNSAAQSR
jgi:hypothetical protein